MEGALIEGTLTLGAETKGTLTEGGFDLELPRERFSKGIRSSSRGSGLLLPDFGAAGNGLTTPVVQKSFRFVGLELLSCGLQPVKFSEFSGTGGKALFVGDSLPFGIPTSTYPGVVFPLPYRSFKALTKGVDPRLSEEASDDSPPLFRGCPLLRLLRSEAR